jgi:hypothetical protein
VRLLGAVSSRQAYVYSTDVTVNTCLELSCTGSSSPAQRQHGAEACTDTCTQAWQNFQHLRLLLSCKRQWIRTTPLSQCKASVLAGLDRTRWCPAPTVNRDTSYSSQALLNAVIAAFAWRDLSQSRQFLLSTIAKRHSSPDDNGCHPAPVDHRSYPPIFDAAEVLHVHTPPHTNLVVTWRLHWRSVPATWSRPMIATDHWPKPCFAIKMLNELCSFAESYTHFGCRSWKILF